MTVVRRTNVLPRTDVRAEKIFHKGSGFRSDVSEATQRVLTFSAMTKRWWRILLRLMLLLELLVTSMMIPGTVRAASFFAIRSSSFLIRHHPKHPFAPPQHTSCAMSVSGTIYSANQEDAPVVTLFTKAGCTLCDKVQAVLQDLRDPYPHALVAVDITEDSFYFERYQFDIPVLHLNGAYWTKHRLTVEDAAAGLSLAHSGAVVLPVGGAEPDARQSRPRGSSR